MSVEVGYRAAVDCLVVRGKADRLPFRRGRKRLLERGFLPLKLLEPAGEGTERIRILL